ncbi:MAG TPA: PorV/PorQ family protein [Candidatus Limnocylindria bacterium]|nr:PorV/PorQ family protein [Candidatus Limnocylindria bacterium]
MNGKTLMSLIVLTLAAAPAFGQSKTGTTMGQFLLIEPSARITGMGNAGVSMFEGLDAVYYNPAAIGRASRYEVMFAHSAWLADISYDYVAAAIPLGRWGNGFASVTSLNSGEIDVRTVSAPLGTGERYRVSDVALALGYGKEITDRFSAGVQVAWLQETIWNSSVSTMTIGLGTRYRISENGLHIGSSLTNFGTEGRYSGRDLRILYDNDPDRFGDNGALPGERFTDGYPVPVLFRVGVGMPFRPAQGQALSVAVDAFHPNDNTESVSAGAEWTMRDMLALRAGYQNAFQQDSEVGLTLGAGLNGRLDLYRYRFDYAWADHGRLGSTHRFAVDLAF